MHFIIATAPTGLRQHYRCRTAAFGAALAGRWELARAHERELVSARIARAFRLIFEHRAEPALGLDGRYGRGTKWSHRIRAIARFKVVTTVKFRHREGIMLYLHASRIPPATYTISPRSPASRARYWHTAAPGIAGLTSRLSPIPAHLDVCAHRPIPLGQHRSHSRTLRPLHTSADSSCRCVMPIRQSCRVLTRHQYFCRRSSRFLVAAKLMLTTKIMMEAVLRALNQRALRHAMSKTPPTSATPTACQLTLINALYKGLRLSARACSHLRPGTLTAIKDIHYPPSKIKAHILGISGTATCTEDSDFFCKLKERLQDKFAAREEKRGQKHFVHEVDAACVQPNPSAARRVPGATFRNILQQPTGGKQQSLKQAVESTCDMVVDMALAELIYGDNLPFSL
eukprot:6196849-Pleurochrysis_carterae.AAC.1